MPQLFHYTKIPFHLRPRGPLDYFDSDDGAKPGGLWLSALDSSNAEGWFQGVLRSASNSPNEWCHYDVRYETEFDLIDPVPREILVLTCEPDYDQFISDYGSQDHQGSVSICWECVRGNYKGIAIDPFRKELSRGGSNQARYNWNSFDCSSWCLWDLKYLLEEEYISTVECNRQMQIPDPRAFSHMCDCCTDYFGRNPHMQ